ncbi:PfkB family carbohydrate kinase [Leifsonia sp. PS1209]|uniref:PfkB family carbohydrate kinase n=1 Tax=Leifsonia sp. PS1209 TaxID=2724914 RepID=UPI001442C3A2|nr:PfkB family carbohydrate kinase [Leifsonia sp. PS1209]QJA00226.1 carbohydrate kinase [Leifsonia sp. PS1209]
MTAAPASAAADVLVIGESVMDIILTRDEELHRPGGSPMNVAVGLAKLGNRVELLTNLGADPAGHAITRHLELAGVRVLDASYTADPTSHARATLAADGSATYDFDIVWRLPETSLRPQRVIHTGSIGAILEPGAHRVHRIIESQPQALISFDPNIRPGIMGTRDKVRRMVEATSAVAHVVKMSEEDAEWLYPGAGADVVCRALIAAGARLAIVTLGADGSIVHTPDFALRLPAFSAVVADTVGAGDSFTSALLAGIIRRDLVDTLREARLGRGEATDLATEAMAAAAITVSRTGANPPTVEELEAYLTEAGRHTADTEH